MIDEDDVQPGIIDAPFGASGAVQGRDTLAMLSGTTGADRRDALRCLRDLARAQAPGVSVTIGLSAAGLRRLGVDPALVMLFPAEWLAGAPSRSALLRDPDPAGWEHCLGHADFDVIVMASTREADAQSIEDFHAKLTPLLDGAQCVPMSLTADHREPFGFRDGISNPRLEGSGRTVEPGNGVWTGSRWRPLRAGEILYGYPDETGSLPGVVAAHDLLRNGSMLAWRKIEQHLDAFTALAARVCDSKKHVPPHRPGPGVPCEDCRAELIGRNQDGTARSASVGDNGFTFQEPDAYRVSTSSHVRRSNPRTGEHFAGVAGADSHRMIRRSMRWDDSDAGRTGTVFRCYQTSIASQFEFVQREWCNHGDHFREGRIMDPVTGSVCPISAPVLGADPSERERLLVTWNRDPDSRVAVIRPNTQVPGSPRSPDPVTTVLGAFYAFVPGHRSLDGFVSGRWAS